MAVLWKTSGQSLHIAITAIAILASHGLADETLPQVNTTGAVPSDAVVIFDGTSAGLLVGPNGEAPSWPIEDGAIVCAPGKQQRQQGLWTKLHFRDVQIHVEFMVPHPGEQGEGRGNSGIYLHGLFEQQIYDSHTHATRPIETVGAIYGISPPKVNAGRPPGVWQAYDIFFKAPRRDEQGEPIEPGSITTLLNGVLVQHEVPITRRKSEYTPLYFRTTPYAERIRESLLETDCGPFQLQDHDSPVAFRNIWIRPLDEKAFVFE